MRFFSLPEYFQYMLIFFNLLIVVINVYSAITCIIFSIKKRYFAVNISVLVSAAVMYFVAVYANFDYRKTFIKESSVVLFFDKLAPVFILLLIFFTALSVLTFRAVMRWKKNNITTASIKEGMDKLPAGLCYHNEKGVPKLINHRMDNLCRVITGDPLFDGNEFWQKLSSGRVLYGNTVVKCGSNPIITLSDNSTVSFTKIEREIGTEKMFEIRATDITKQYALNVELQENNNELRQLNRRLSEYGENVWDITREREILTAKVNIHDMLGKALLVTKRYIENGDVDVSKEELTDIWRGTLYLFDGGFSESPGNNSLDELYAAAKLMGIKLTVKGKIPKDNRLLRFIMSGARECLTNAVHHAKATELTLSLYSLYGFFFIEYTNDGLQPTEAISEGGGLSSLRQSVEKDGGIMETDIVPRFILRLKIPLKEVY